MNNILTYVCVQVNIVCNLNCIHCRAGSNPTLKGEIDKDQMLAFVDNLMILGLNHVNITGGEPTMYSKINELIDDLLNRDLWVTITTNGLTDFTKIVQRINNPNISKLRWRVSIDGGKSMHEFIRGENTYERTLKNLKTASENQFWLAVNTVLYTDTIYSIPDLYNDIKNTRIDEWAIITPVHSKNDFDTILECNEDKNFHAQNINKAEKLIRDLGFQQHIHIINFYSNPNTYLFVNERGWVSFPSFSENYDILLGHIANIDINDLKNKILDSIATNSKSYFKW